MDCIVGAWTQDEFNYNGEFFQYEGVQLTPKPYQRPRPPIWIGAFAPKAMERALNYEGWCTWFPPHVDVLGPAVKDMRERAAERGKDDFQVTLGFEGWLSNDRDVREKHGHRWVREWSFYAEQGLSPDVEGDTMLDLIENMFLETRSTKVITTHRGPKASRLSRPLARYSPTCARCWPNCAPGRFSQPAAQRLTQYTIARTVAHALFSVVQI